MTCQRASSITSFEYDLPDVTFTVTADGEPFRFNNTRCTLHVVTPDGVHVAQFELGSPAPGTLNLEGSRSDAFYAEFAKLTPDISYRAQIYVEATPPGGEGIGLYDIVSPYWTDYVPESNHIPGWFSGEPRVNQTIPTQIPWVVREAFKLRGN